MPGSRCPSRSCSDSSRSGSPSAPELASSGHSGGRKAGGRRELGRILGWLGVYLALIGAISLAVYYVEYHLLA